MEKNRKIAIIYYIAAVICYICSVCWFCTGKGGLGALWLCIGSANLCLGSVWMNRSRESEQQNKQEDEKSEEA